MAGEKHLNESHVNYQTLTSDLSEPVIIERDGQPIAVVVAYAEYQRLKVVESDNAWQREEAKQHLETLLTRVHARPTELSAEEIEAEITEAVQEVREERNARRSRH